MSRLLFWGGGEGSIKSHLITLLHSLSSIISAFLSLFLYFSLSIAFSLSLSASLSFSSVCFYVLLVNFIAMCWWISVYIYIYIYIHMCVHVCVMCIYLFLWMYICIDVYLGLSKYILILWTTTDNNNNNSNNNITNSRVAIRWCVSLVGTFHFISHFLLFLPLFWLKFLLHFGRHAHYMSLFLVTWVSSCLWLLVSASLLSNSLLLRPTALLCKRHYLVHNINTSTAGSYLAHFCGVTLHCTTFTPYRLNVHNILLYSWLHVIV